jgi:hypothetical protein
MDKEEENKYEILIQTCKNTKSSYLENLKHTIKDSKSGAYFELGIIFPIFRVIILFLFLVPSNHPNVFFVILLYNTIS